MHYDVVHPGEVSPLKDVAHPNEVPPLEEMVQLVEKVPLDRVLLNVVQSKPALSMPVNPDEVLLEGEVPLNVVHSDKVPPLEEVVQLKEVPLDVVQDKPAQEQMVEDTQCKRKLQQMEADSPAVNVIAYMYIIAKLEM